ncbi:hypothetical protein [Alteromonas mediterranea]|uniref:Uncharacterized protein n=1 Tax=Alteromonas mediterranea (strain DSM 17117 / CIP 110805 / LMG 28347 / Deep ecotype) TaxID=1774373 RepID=F2GC92_ALTMD|nr:hypothetical protein [Alteromonas mediterranea]AEA99048.1 hypothetical protein MADE_1014570 [Alteromonas mediterranea DE]
MKLLYLLAFMPMVCSAYDGLEQAQIIICGVIAEDLKNTYTMKDLDPDVFFDEYNKIQEETGLWTEQGKEKSYAHASYVANKTKTEFADLNPVGKRRDPVYQLFNDIHDSSFHAWGFYSCEGMYRRLNAGE